MSDVDRPVAARPPSEVFASLPVVGAGRARASMAAHRVKLIGMEVLEAASPQRWGSLSAVQTDRPHFVLTFDDGPTPERTPQVMKALAQRHASATFFVLMRNVRAHPGLLRDLMTEGHEIALHGADHRRLRTVAPLEFGALLKNAKAELEDLIGRSVRWYRPPYGEQTIPTWRAVQALGLTSVLWSRTTWDWKHTGPEARLAVATMKPRPGAILLAHDGHAGPEDGADPMVEPDLNRHHLVSSILDAYARRGMTSRTLGGVVDEGTPVYRAQFVLGARKQHDRAPRSEAS